MAKVVDPTLAEMRRLEAPFVGCLYVGLALTSAGPKVIEFNVRFGDPDIQPVLALLDSPLGALLAAAAVGNLADVPEPEFVDGAAVSVVMASAGYPEGSSHGRRHRRHRDPRGRDRRGRDPRRHGPHRRRAWSPPAGRVLAVRATGTDVADARAKAYEGISSISFPGAQWRRDIAAEPLGVVEGAASRG